jgi:histidinol-phosphatase
MHHYSNGVEARLKADDSPVTEADEAVEVLLRDALAELRPDDAVIGEEFGATHAAQRTWVLDPIDGTSFYARGDPNWRIQIALMTGDAVVVAVVDAPAMAVRWHASRGEGAYETSRSTPGASRRLRVAPTAETVPIVAAHPRPMRARLMTPTQEPPRSPLPLINLVRGEIDAFYVDCCQLWDHAPWVLIVEEAGGRFTDHEGGHRADRSGGLYSSPAIHDALLAAVDRTALP